VKTERRSNMMALKTEIIFLKICNQRHKFSFYSYIYKLGKHAGSVVQLCANLLHYAMKYLYKSIQSLEIKVKMSSFVLIGNAIVRRRLSAGH